MKVKGDKPEEEHATIRKSDLYEDRSTAIIAYIPILGILIALVKNKEEKNNYTSFHIRQVLGIYCVGLLIVILACIPKLSMTIHFIGMLLVVLLWVFGLISAVNGERKKVFVFGTFFQKWFKGIK